MPKVHVRWMIRNDMPAVLEIEQLSFPRPWNEEEFLRILRERNVMPCVAEYKGEVVGYTVFMMQKTQILILNLAVHPSIRRWRVGEALMAKVRDKLARRTRIGIVCDEYNLGGQLFLRSQFFRAYKCVQGNIWFRYECGQPTPSKEVPLAKDGRV